MATTKFMEAGTDATFGFEMWSGVSGTVTSDTAIKTTGPRSVKCDSGGGSGAAFVKVNNVVQDIGSRVVVSFWQSDAPGGRVPILSFSSASALVFDVDVNQNGAISVTNGGAGVKSGPNLDFIGGLWNTISVAYVITSTTNFTIKVFLDGNIVLTVTNTDFSLLNTGAIHCSVGWVASPAGANLVLNFDDVYIDNGTTLDDPGAIRVTAKLPNALGSANNFDTEIGSSANRWDDVDERALSEAKGWRHNAATDVQENYKLQQAGEGDVNILNSTLVARTAWLWGKRQVGAGTLGTTLTNVGKATGTTLVLPSSGTTAVSVGDLVVVLFSDLVAGATPTIADTLVNSWTILAGPTTNGVRFTAWYSKITTGGNTTITITFGSSAAGRAGVSAKFTGITTTPLDKNPANANDATSPYDCPATGTLTDSDELVLGLVALNGPGGDTFAATSPDTKAVSVGSTGGSPGTNATAGIIYRNTLSTATVTPEATNSSNRTGVVGTATFKTGVQGGTPKIMDNGAETAITLTGTPALFTLITDSAVYPSNVAGIGMRSNNSSADTFLYECGTLISFIPGTIVQPAVAQQANAVLQGAVYG